MKINLPFFTILFLLFMLGSCGTEDFTAVVGSINGTVVNAETLSPIAGCEVISNDFGTKLTDDNGHFSFTDVDPGIVTLNYKAKGYEPASRQIAVKAGLAVSADVSLTPDFKNTDLYAEPTVLNFGTTEVSLSFRLINPTANSIGYDITSEADWIIVDKPHGTVGDGKQLSIKVTVDRKDLSNGSYDKLLSIETTNKSTFSVQIQVDKGTIARPTVSTTSVKQSSDSPTTVIATGGIVSMGGSKIKRHGFCYAVGVDPTLENNDGITNLGDLGSVSSFTSNLLDLNYNQEYHIRAYATNESGTGYGETLIITLQKQEFATVATSVAESITSSSVILSGNISSGNANSFSKLGFYYGTTPSCSNRTSVDPTINGTSFKLQLINLTPNTEYFYRAYGEDNRGTQYGEVKSFRTSKDTFSEGTITIVSSNATNIGVNKATLNGALTTSGNIKIKEYGFFYGTNSNPTLRKIVDSFAATKVSSQSFSTEVAGLKENTKYYFQSYTIDERNNLVKGEVLSFTTKVQPSIKINSFYAEYEEFWPREIFYIKGSATLFPEGETVIEAGFLCDPNFEPDYKNSSANRFICEIVNNKISFEETRQGGSGSDRFEAYNRKTNIKAYMILSDGRIIYSDIYSITLKNPL